MCLGHVRRLVSRRFPMAHLANRQSSIRNRQSAAGSARGMSRLLNPTFTLEQAASGTHPRDIDPDETRGRWLGVPLAAPCFAGQYQDLRMSETRRPIRRRTLGVASAISP